MATWDEVNSDFGGNETINFGPRLEVGTSLYQLETHATISPRGMLTGLPQVSACAAAEMVLVSADRQLNVYGDNCRKYLVTLDFESCVCGMSVTDDGKYLACGEQSGVLHLFDITNCVKLFSTKLEETASEESGLTFVEIALRYRPQEKDHILLVVGSSGRLHVFGMDLTGHCEAVVAKDNNRIRSLQEQTDHQIITASEFGCTSVTYATVLPSSGDMISIGSGESSAICLWRQEKKRFVPYCTAVYPSNEALGKCVVTNCEQFLLTLNDSHHLSLWSVDNLTVVWHLDSVAIKDFATLNDETSSKAVSVFTLSVESDGHCHATIYTIPEMECLYSVRLNSFVTRARCSRDLDGFYLVEGDSHEENGSVARLRVRSLTEALPESRLQRMLGRKRFDEAEEFARKYELDLQPVYRAKAEHLLDFLSPRNKTDLDEVVAAAHILALKDCLGSIADDRFVVDCCISAALPSLEAMSDLLEHIKTWMKIRRPVSKELGQLTRKVTEVTHRLGTFQMVFTDGSYSWFRWDVFRSANMLQELASHLENGRMHAVSTIWTRHHSDFQQQLSGCYVAQLLRKVPEETPSEKLREWLSKGLIPVVVQRLPEALPAIAAWIGERARNMELMERSGWPRNALEFCELLVANFRMISASWNEDAYATQASNFWVAHSTKQGSKESSTCNAFLQLQVLSDELSALCELHVQYNCRLSLADFQLESVESITYRMLDRVVAAELIPDAIRKTLRPYMKQHGLEEDRMLYQYVGDLSKRYGKMFSCLGDAPWEAKAVQVVRCISDPELRCQALLTAMAGAYVPWSVDMETVVKETLAMADCPRAKEIEEKRRMVELENMLVTYGLRDVNLADRYLAENLAYYVLSQDQPSAVSDALLVVSFYSHLDEMHIYLFRAKFLVERGRAEELRRLFDGLSPTVAQRLGERFASTCRLTLSSSFPKLAKAAYTQACCDVVRLMRKLHAGDVEWKDGCEETLGVMESICSLQQEFGEFPSVEEYETKTYRTECLRRYAERAFGGPEEDGGKGDGAPNGKRREEEVLVWNPERKRGRSKMSPYSSLYRLARLLRIPREDVGLELVTVAIDRDDVVAAIGICKDIRETVPDVRAGPVLMTVARKLLAVALDAERCKGFPDLASQVDDLARAAAASVPPDLLLEGLELCRMTRMAVATWNQCEGGDYQSTVGRGPGNALTLPDVDNIYVEDGLILDSSRILPMVGAIDLNSLLQLRQSSSSYLQNRLQLSPEALSETLDSLFSATWNVIDYLRDNAQGELALGFAMEAVALATEFLLSRPPTASNGSGDEDALGSALLQNIRRLVNVVQEMLIASLQKVFLCSRPDLPMAVACLCSLPKQVSFNCLMNLAKTAGFQYKRAGYIAQVGLSFALLVKECHAQKSCQALADNARWGYQLAKLHISFREAFRGGKEEKFRLLPSLVQSRLVTITDLCDYCVTFEMDKDRAFLDCLRHLMTAADAEQVGDVPVCTLPVEEAVVKARNLCRNIESTEDLVRGLESILARLDPYDYDRIEFVLGELENVRPTAEKKRNRKVMTFLKQYRSKTSPGGRIPYHPLVTGAHWSVITPELTAETVDDWLPTAALLGLPADDVMVTAVRNIIERHVKEGMTPPGPVRWRDDAVNWKLYYVTSKLLTKISSCELAVASAVWIVKMLPTGAEKLLALKSCVTMAKKWQEACAEGSADLTKAQKTSTEHSAMYRRLLTEQILHNRCLADPDLLALSGSPAKLVFKLYEHPCITVGRNPLRLKAILPDIHAVVDEIAAANRVDAKKIRATLVDRWLPSSAKHMQEFADVTMTVGEEVVVSGETDEDEANLLRVIYLLRCRPTEEAALHLINLAYINDATVTYPCRVRAFQCLFALADVDLVQRLLPQKTVSKICEEVKVFLCLGKLEKIGMPQTPESFERLSKEGLARTIWRNHNHDLSAVALVSDLCLEYSVGDEQLWSCIFQQLLSFRSITGLCGLLERMSEVSSVWRLPFLGSMLDGFIASVLGSASAPLTGDRLSDCLHLCSLGCRRTTTWTVETIDKWMVEFGRLQLKPCTIGWTLLLPPGESRQRLLMELTDREFLLNASQQLTIWTKAGYDVPLVDLVSEYVGGTYGELQGATTLLCEKSPLSCTYLEAEMIFE